MEDPPMDRRTFLGTLTGGLLAAPPAAVAQQEAALVGRAWRLVRYGDITSPKAAPSGRRGPWGPASLQFGQSAMRIPPPEGEDSLRVNDGCNEIFGLLYRVDAGRLVVTFSKGWGGTAIACPDEQQSQVAAFIRGLQNSARFVVQGDMLTIFYDGGKSALVFQAGR
jgi:hypothetical protein